MVKKLVKQKEKKKPKADESLHTQDGDVNTEATDESMTQFKAKLNRYGFIHVPKKAWSALPFKIEDHLEARIDGDHLTISVATENQPRTKKI